MFETKSISRDEVILSVIGSLSGETTPEFHRQVEQLVAASYGTITLDLSRTDAINSPALGKILAFKKMLAEQQRVLQIRGCSDSLYKTFQMAKVDLLVSIQK
jgi:anti-anti-sigma factor